MKTPTYAIGRAHWRRVVLFAVIGLWLSGCGGSGSGTQTDNKITPPIIQNLTLDYAWINGMGCLVDQNSLNPGYRVLCFGSAIVNSPNDVIVLMSNDTDYVTAITGITFSTLCVQTRSQMGFCWGAVPSDPNVSPILPSQIAASESQGVIFGVTPTSMGYWNVNITDGNASTSCTLMAGVYTCPSVVPGGLNGFTLQYGGPEL